jgi:hypothetical protein
MFVERFRDEMRRRVAEMRQRRDAPGRPGFGPGAGPGGRQRPPRGDRPGSFPRR